LNRRLLLVLGVILALLDVRWTRSTRDLATVFLLDRSASTQGAWESALAFVEESLAGKGARDRAAVVVFGADAWVDRGFSVASGLDAVATFPRADATDIEEAVRLALALIPSGAPGRLELLTDGLATAGRAENALRESHMQGVDLLVAQMGETSTGPEVWLEGLRLPTQVYPGDRVAAAITVGAEGVPSAGLAWTAGRQSGQDVLRLSDTRDTFIFSFVAESAGFMPVRACIEGTSDTFSQNNCVSGWLVVQGAPAFWWWAMPWNRRPWWRRCARPALRREPCSGGPAAWRSGSRWLCCGGGGQYPGAGVCPAGAGGTASLCP
jgi:hypothetical protein